MPIVTAKRKDFMDNETDLSRKFKVVPDTILTEKEAAERLMKYEIVAIASRSVTGWDYDSAVGYSYRNGELYEQDASHTKWNVVGRTKNIDYSADIVHRVVFATATVVPDIQLRPYPQLYRDPNNYSQLSNAEHIPLKPIKEIEIIDGPVSPEAEARAEERKELHRGIKAAPSNKEIPPFTKKLTAEDLQAEIDEESEALKFKVNLGRIAYTNTEAFELLMSGNQMMHNGLGVYRMEDGQLQFLEQDDETDIWVNIGSLGVSTVWHTATLIAISNEPTKESVKPQMFEVVELHTDVVVGEGFRFSNGTHVVIDTTKKRLRHTGMAIASSTMGGLLEEINRGFALNYISWNTIDKKFVFKEDV